MNLKQQSLVLIENGEWTFELLGLPVVKALKARVCGLRTDLMNARLSPMEWALLSYQKPTPCFKSISVKQNKVICPTSQSKHSIESLGSLAQTVFDCGTIGNFSQTEELYIREAIKTIGHYAPMMCHALSNWITHFLKLDNVPFRSGSHPHAFGCIMLSSRIGTMTTSDLATSIIHEMGHQDLFLLNTIDRLIVKDADYYLAHAPFQGKLRPPIGRLHSYFALFRMVQFQVMLGNQPEHYIRLFNETLSSFAKNELTEFGHQLVSAARGYVQKILKSKEINVL